jgi:hypothetical protein
MQVALACDFSLAEALLPREDGRCLIQSGASWHRCNNGRPPPTPPRVSCAELACASDAAKAGEAGACGRAESVCLAGTWLQSCSTSTAVT